MAPAKRTAATQKAGRPAKVAKVEVDPFVEKCQCVFDILKEFAPELPKSCAEMLRLSAPIALATLQADRHAYQNAVVEELNCLITVADTKCEADISEASDRVSTHAGEKETMESRLAEARADDQSKKSTSETAAQALVAAEADEAAARAAAALVVDAECAASLQVQHATKAQAEFDAELEGTWRLLLADGFAPKDWRNRNKIITRAMQLLAASGAPTSLIDALTVALKEKTAERGPFAIKALEVGETIFADHVASIAANVGTLQGEQTTCQNAVANANAEVVTKTTVVAERLEASVIAENIWNAANTTTCTLAEEVAGFDDTAKALAGELELRRATLARLHELVGGFHVVRDATLVIEAPVVAEPVVQETVADVTPVAVEKTEVDHAPIVDKAAITEAPVEMETESAVFGA